MYMNRIENRINFKIINGYYLELLTPETMKLLRSTESKITKDKSDENVPHLEIVELVFVKLLLKIHQLTLNYQKLNYQKLYNQEDF